MLPLLQVLQFLPLLLFIATYRITGDWKPAFMVGGLLALLQIIVLLYKKMFLKRFVLAVNCFLIGGAAMFIFNIEWLQNMYDHFLFTTLFVWLCIIGLITTFFSSIGFIGIEHRDQKIVRALSLNLLAGTIGATVFSWYFHGNFLLSAVIPWIFLLVLRAYLEARA